MLVMETTFSISLKLISQTLLIHEKTQRKIILKLSSFDTVVSLNTDSFEKLYKEFEIVLYHGLRTPRSC